MLYGYRQENSCPACLDKRGQSLSFEIQRFGQYLMIEVGKLHRNNSVSLPERLQMDKYVNKVSGEANQQTNSPPTPIMNNNNFELIGVVLQNSDSPVLRQLQQKGKLNLQTV